MGRTAPLVALAPGAAYGGAKRWPPASFAELAGALAGGRRRVRPDRQRGRRAATGDAIHRALGGATRSSNLIGRTDLPTLAGVLACCRALVTNDSGAMHLAAAVGVASRRCSGRPTNRETRPLGDAPRGARRTRSGAAPACCASARSIIAACAASRWLRSLDAATADAVNARRCSSIATAR